MSLPRLVFRPCLRPRLVLVRGFHTSRFNYGIKILFCGSDDFSLKSLQTLQAIKESPDNSSIDSIEVLLKYEAPKGRGLKEQRLNPVREFATEKSLEIYSLDEQQFQDWKPPRPLDLIIAVSFGLFIPSRILEHARFGGLNVHPSFLPKYWGASPIQHALLNKDKSTGVVVQTLHPEKFDAGKIIAKSEPVEISFDTSTFPPPMIDKRSPYRQLESKLAEVGANLLGDVIKNQHYDHVVQRRLPAIETGETRKRASLLTTEDSRILFGKMTGEDVFLRGLVFDRLFCYQRKVRESKAGKESRVPERVKMGPFRLPTSAEYEEYLKGAGPERQYVYIPNRVKKSKAGSLALQVSPGDWVCVQYFTVAGKGQKDAQSLSCKDPKVVNFISHGPEESE
ncbi:Methionyl-tRNA formyltransferase [Orbilia blumenaviensis]|uniref:methionyl-tRNA formyltransferase n=1 Tax=Orbilia blumenaviensis TaxID=1796055 RepID=A0AAV9UWY2_9PEZI